MRALAKGQRAIVRKDIKKTVGDPALRAVVERVLLCAVLYEELTDDHR